MALNDLDNERIEKALAGFLAKHRPLPWIRAQLDIGHRLAGQRLEFPEIRPQWDRPTIIREHPFAKATYVRPQNCWNILWRESSLRSKRHEPMVSAAAIKEFLNIVDADEYRCFFG